MGLAHSTKIKTFGALNEGDRFRDSNDAIYTVYSTERIGDVVRISYRVKYEGYAGRILDRAPANASDPVDGWTVA